MKRLRTQIFLFAICLAFGSFAMYSCTSYFGDQEPPVAVHQTSPNRATPGQYPWTPAQAAIRAKLLADPDFMQTMVEHRKLAKVKIERMSKLSKAELRAVYEAFKNDKRPTLARYNARRLRFNTAEEITAYEVSARALMVKWKKRLSKEERKVLMDLRTGFFKALVYEAASKQTVLSNARTEEDCPPACCQTEACCYTTPEICDCLGWCENDQYSCEFPYETAYEDCRRSGENEDICRSYTDPFMAQCLEEGTNCATNCLSD